MIGLSIDAERISAVGGSRELEKTAIFVNIGKSDGIVIVLFTVGKNDAAFKRRNTKRLGIPR